MHETQQALTVKEMAALLGISPAAVVKRIGRGRLLAERGETGQWVIPWPQDIPDGQDKTNNRTGQDTPNESAYLRDTLTRQEAEILFLREELRRRDDELQRKDAVHMQTLQQLRALMPPEDRTAGQDRTGQQDRHTGHGRPWWKWWG